MRVTLMHNPGAGDEQPSPATLLALLREAGYVATYRSAEGEDVAGALADPGDLVIAAGGDGTVAKVATQLVDQGVPMAIVPVGTANNIAATLGVCGSPAEVIAGLPSAARRRLDVGTVRGPRGTTRFVEAVGVGLVGRMLLAAERGEGEHGGAPPRSRGERIERGLRELRRVLRDYRARDWRVTADGEDLSGRYLAVEAMSIRCIGPGLPLAPQADHGDGQLDLALLEESDRGVLDDYLASRIAGRVTPSPFRARRVRQVRLGWGQEGHVDDALWPAGARKGGEGGGTTHAAAPADQWVDVRLADTAVEVLVPATAR
jgi:diacylglycerol kinase family enzyme